MGKTKCKVRNWREDNQALKDRFSLTIYIDKGLDKRWKPDPTRERGRPYEYGDHVDLRSRKFKNQEAEAMMKLSLLNKMTDLGMPDSVPVK